MSNTVIGFKGTAEERLVAWNTILLLRKSLAWMKKSHNESYQPAIDKEEKWLQEEFDDYRKVA